MSRTPPSEPVLRREQDGGIVVLTLDRPEAILSCDARTIREIKRVSTEGWATSLEEGLRLEAAASRSFARSVSASDVAARRRGVQERGRSQSS